MSWLVFLLLAIIAWLLHRLVFVVQAYRDDLADLRQHLDELKKSTIVAQPPGIGKISLNKASKSQLQTLPNVGTVTAQRIIAARPFVNLEELLKVEGITPRLFEALKANISV